MPRLVNSALIFLIVFLVSFKEKATSAKKIKPEENLNIIQFSDSALTRFKVKIDSLKKGLRKKIRIVHIGDSHVQADLFTGEIRRQLQKELGNGGRGLIFPYFLAKTNGPGKYFKSADNNWQSCRNVKCPHKFPLGICGISLQHFESGNINLDLSRDSTINDSNNVLLFYSKSASVELSIDKKIKKRGDQKLKPCDTAFVSRAGKNVEMDWNGKGEFYFHGAYVENYLPGLIYNMIGVNGACYKDYSTTEYFFVQLPFLRPDLIIISLGTNESYAPKYNDAEFESDVKIFLSLLKQACPNSEVILTGVSENFFKQKKKIVENNRVNNINKIIRKQAMDNDLGFWDLYDIMGGKGSMKTWKKKNLAGPDYVHFTRKGYTLQAGLLSAALIKTFN